MNTTPVTDRSRAAKPVNRPGFGGVQTLITALSVAAVLGGWAVISNRDRTSVAVAAPADNGATLPAAAPTIQPLPTVAAVAGLNDLAAQAAAAPATSTSVLPTPQVAPSQPLRSVRAPRVAARTRSSR